jgi:long-chain acyl-CoA synthetase
MAYLGALLADATVVPVDPEMSPSEIGRIARKSEARVIITHEEHTLSLEALECEVWASEREAEGAPLSLLTLSACFEAEPLDEASLSTRDRSQELASLLFTSGTTGDPKGVMLTHENFCALLSSLHGVFKVDHRDRFLSVLPLFHTFEFSAGLLLPLSAGARVTYLTELEGPTLRAAMKEIKPTGIVGIPALWDVLQKRIETQVKDKHEAAQLLFKLSVKLNRQLRLKGLNVGPLLFSQVHAGLGGKVRYLVSGGAALSEGTLEVFEGLGFELLEGYGLTEAAPVLAVKRPHKKLKKKAGVGPAIPGVELKIHNPNEEGVGEVLARGPNVMAGYLNDPESTSEVVRDGWLHTGDLGSLNERGELVLSGRSKELIVTSSGKNVYPDELEPLFADHEYIEELSIVGVPDTQGDERVAALIVLKEGAPEEAQREVKAHIAQVNAQRPDHQRLRAYRFWPNALPRTATRKVKRSEVRATLTELLEVGRAARLAERSEGQKEEQRSTHKPTWLYALSATLCGRELHELSPDLHLTTDLGLSSLQRVELRSSMEERLQRPLSGEAFNQAERLSDLAELAQGAQGEGEMSAPARGGAESSQEGEERGPTEERTPLWRDLPEPTRAAGQRLIDTGRSLAFNNLFKLNIKGQANVPLNQQVIVIANHSSHLDIGLIKEALGPLGDELAVLAARDYFFNNDYKEAFFGQLTHLAPIDRSAPLEQSMRVAEEVIATGRSLLIYPEGTRSTTGELQPFKVGVGYLQRHTGLPVLPLFLTGTHKAMPKQGGLPRFGRALSARVGRLIEPEVFEAACADKRRHEAYQAATERCYEAIVALRDGKAYPWERPVDHVEEPSEVEALVRFLEGRFAAERVSEAVTWYFSLGDASDQKWTVSATPEGFEAHVGKPKKGQADCVLKTDLRTFERMIREGYVPSFAEFASGKVKTNNPQGLYSLQTIFAL